MRCEHGSGERRGRAALARVWHGTHRARTVLARVWPATSVTVLAAAMEGRGCVGSPTLYKGEAQGSGVWVVSGPYWGVGALDLGPPPGFPADRAQRSFGWFSLGLVSVGVDITSR